MLTEVPAKYLPNKLDPPHFVCDVSLNVHICGNDCRYGVALPRAEGYVCRLTGRVLPYVDMLRSVQSVDGEKNAHSNNRVKGATYSTMGTSEKKQTAKKQRSASCDKGKHIVEYINILTSVLKGSERITMYNAQVARYEKDKAKLLKELEHASVEEKHSRMQLLDAKYTTFLNKPAYELDNSRITQFANILYNYSRRIEPYLDKKIHAKVVSTYAAFMTQKLAKGYTIDDVNIIPCIEEFQRHVPASIQYSGFHMIASKNISAFSRAFRRACVTSDMTVRYPMVLDKTEFDMPSD